MATKINHLIQAPHGYEHCPRPWVFLAGSIEMGQAENWQQRCEREIVGATILNPRRDDWDLSWVQSKDHTLFFEQVTWKLKAQEDADLIVFYFAPDTAAPITLLELGLRCSYESRDTIVCCPKGFYRSGNVEIVCDRYGITFVDTLDLLIEVANDEIKGYVKVNHGS